MSKHNNRTISSSISEITGLPLEILGKAPIFQLFSDRELIIEGAKNIEYYDELCVKVMTDKIHVTVNGERLVIKCLANKNLSVCGDISMIQLERIRTKVVV